MGHIHDDNCKPKTAVQEAMIVVAQMGEEASHSLAQVKWYQFKHKYMLRGIILACLTVLQALSVVDAKYENSDGHFN